MLDDAGFRSLFSGSPIKRIGVKRFLRNCLVAAGNSGDLSLLGRVRSLTEDEDPVVAEAAAWAERRLVSVPAAQAGAPAD
jgi:epoxyqueuosine reductase